MATRVEVYRALDSERNYQDQRWGDRGVLPVGEWVDYIRRYHEAAAAAVTAEDYEAAMDNVRKIAGLAVVCMEQHGAPMRDPDAINQPVSDVAARWIAEHPEAPYQHLINVVEPEQPRRRRAKAETAE